jgi:sterol desaturase/sphingolipid hydroxylase (fatty acid hydroxylase superfamily)
MEVPNFPSVTQLAVPLFIATMIVELLVGKLRGSATYETRDTGTSLVMGAGSIVSGMLFGFISFGVLLWLWQVVTPMQLGFSLAIGVVAFVLDDLRYYWAHRFGHVSRWIWAAHVVHHSSQHYNLSTALRQTWTGTLAGWWLFRIPLVLLGFHPALLAFCGGINMVYQYWIHTEAIDKLPRWFEAVFNTPSHHRVHHGTNPRYLDANYAGTLIVWDRMFGTFVPELASDKPRYGIVRNLGTFNPLRVSFHEWVAMAKDATRSRLTMPQRLAYLFARPGYSHDGSRKTSVELKADFVARHPDEAGAPGLPPRPAGPTQRA